MSAKNAVSYSQSALYKVAEAILPFVKTPKNAKAKTIKVGIVSLDIYQGEEGEPDVFRRNFEGFLQQLFAEFQPETLKRFLTLEGASANQPSRRELERFQRELIGRARRLLYSSYMNSIRKLPHVGRRTAKDRSKKLAEIRRREEEWKAANVPQAKIVKLIAKLEDCSVRHARRLLRDARHTRAPIGCSSVVESKPSALAR